MKLHLDQARSNWVRFRSQEDKEMEQACRASLELSEADRKRRKKSQDAINRALVRFHRCRVDTVEDGSC